MACSDKDMQDGRTCHEAFPTDPVLWCDDCQLEVAKATVSNASEE